ERLGQIHFWLTLISFNMIFFVQHFLGLAGMPRRIPDYPLMFETWNKISSIGSFIFAVAQVLFLYILVTALRRGERAPQLPWEGADSVEWTHLPTPAPCHSSESPPRRRRKRLKGRSRGRFARRADPAFNAGMNGNGRRLNAPLALGSIALVVLAAAMVQR